MTTIIYNQLYRDSKLYVEFAKIPAEKFAEFYANLVSKETLEDILFLDVEIKMFNSLDKPNINVEFRPKFKRGSKLKDISSLSSFGEISRRVNNIRSFSLFSFLSTSMTKQFNEDFTTKWHQFLTENLGREFYGYLLALHIKESIEAKIEYNHQEQQNLLARLAENKQEEENLSAEMAEFYQQYADILDEDDMPNNTETLNEGTTKKLN